MPLDPRRVQAIFLEAADYHDPVDRVAILDRACSVDLELRQRIEALLRAHDEFNDCLNQPIVGSGPWSVPSPFRERRGPIGPRVNDRIEESRVSNSGG
jgi:hypothetical protein